MDQRTYRAYTVKDIEAIGAARGLSDEQVVAVKAMAHVLPFRVNNYVCDDLISWQDVPNDPMFQLTFPQRGMLEDDDYEAMVSLVRSGADKAALTAAARNIQLRLNPHPSGQRELNVPRLDGEPVRGMQHKYRETVLFFPSQGQTCHAYCSYCFRWAQFVGIDELRFASREVEVLVRYLRAHPEVSDVLITGGDPLIMRTAKLRQIIAPLLELEQIRNIRIGSKALAWWPYRFAGDQDADDLLRLFEEVADSGRQLALMSHYSHPRELETEIAQRALQRVRSSGAVVRCQAPLVRHVNDDAGTWARLWRRQVELGAVPYYMFVERDTGAKNYFEVPLARAQQIFAGAYRQASGLARTVRGPSMSATPGKVVVQGEAQVRGERVFVLQFLQARDPAWVGQPFFARYDDRATWLDQLEPAFGEQRFFFELPHHGRHGRLLASSHARRGKPASRPAWEAAAP